MIDCICITSGHGAEGCGICNETGVRPVDLSSDVRKMVPLVESDGPWLIRSHYWGAWHRRRPTGGVAGYTDDLLHAGVFDFETAKAYHDWGLPGGRNEAIPVSCHLADMERHLKGQQHALDQAAAKVADVRAHLQSARA